MNETEIVKLYNQGYTLREIGSQFNVSYEFVRKILKEQNVPLRRKGRKLADDWERSMGFGRREEDLKVTEVHKPYPFYLIYPSRIDEDEEPIFSYYYCNSLKGLKTAMKNHPIHLAVKLRDWIGCYRADKLIEVRYVIDEVISQTLSPSWKVKAGSKKSFYVEQST